MNLHPYDYANIFSVITDEDGYQFYNLYNNLIIQGDIDHTLYSEVFYNDSDSWYTLSNKYYGTTRLWWVILLVNNVVNPFDDIKTGQKIKILNKEVVSEILSQINIQNG